MTALYVSQRDPFVFTRRSNYGRASAPPASVMLKFGIFFFDYDLDGWLDLLTANGHIEAEIATIQPSQQLQAARAAVLECPRHRPRQFLCSRPNGEVRRGPFQAHRGPRLGLRRYRRRRRSGRAPDPNWRAAPAAAQRSKARSSLAALKLVGKVSNRDAIGAWVKVRLGNRTLSRQVDADARFPFPIRTAGHVWAWTR